MFVPDVEGALWRERCAAKRKFAGPSTQSSSLSVARFVNPGSRVSGFTETRLPTPKSELHGPQP